MTNEFPLFEGTCLKSLGRRTCLQCAKSNPTKTFNCIKDTSLIKVQMQIVCCLVFMVCVNVLSTDKRVPFPDKSVPNMRSNRGMSSDLCYWMPTEHSNAAMQQIWLMDTIFRQVSFLEFPRQNCNGQTWKKQNKAWFPPFRVPTHC